MAIDIPLVEAQEQIFEVIDRTLQAAKRSGNDAGYVLQSNRKSEMCFEYVDSRHDKFEIFARFGNRIGREAFRIEDAWFEPVPDGQPVRFASGYQIKPGSYGPIMRAFFEVYGDLAG